MKKQNKNLRNNKGIALPLFALMLTASLGLGAMVIDVSQGYALKTRIQNAIDSSVLAGISQLNTNSNVSTVKNTALTYLNNNLTSTIPSFQSLALDNSNLAIQVGVYSSTTMTFTQNEQVSVANAIRVSYTYNANTFLAPIFMINNIQITNHSIAAKQIAGYIGPGTGFPLALYRSALTSALSNSNRVNLYSGGGSMDNSFWTNFTSSNPSTTDIKNVTDYFQYGTGTKPPAVTVNDSFRINDGGMGGVFMNLEPSILDGMTYLFPVITCTGGDEEGQHGGDHEHEDGECTSSSSSAMAEGFVAGTIDDIVDSMGDKHISITIVPKQIDNTYGGVGVGPGVGNIGTNEKALLANSCSPVE